MSSEDEVRSGKLETKVVMAINAVVNEVLPTLSRENTTRQKSRQLGFRTVRHVV